MVAPGAPEGLKPTAAQTNGCFAAVASCTFDACQELRE